MKKRISFLSIGGLLLLILTFAVAFVVSQNAHDTYGFFSKVHRVDFVAKTGDDRLTLSFAPYGRGLGILELELQRPLQDRFGTVSALMKDIGNKKVLANVSYTTTHVDSSDPLLIPFRSFAKLGSNEYELTIKTDPTDLLPEYLVQQGLPMQGVYFIDRETLAWNYEDIRRLIDWKITDLVDTFGPMSIGMLFVVPLATPFLLYLLWYQYQKRLLRRVFVDYIIYYLLKPLAWSRQFNAKHLEPSKQTRELMWQHYRMFILHTLHTVWQITKTTYQRHHKVIWDGGLVLMWASACLVFSVTQTEITDAMYIRFAVAYLLFALFRRPDSRLHYFGALFLLVFCPYYISQKLDATAERVAIFVYGFMVTGAFFDAIALYWRKDQPEDAQTG